MSVLVARMVRGFLDWLRERELRPPVMAYETIEPLLLYSRVRAGCGDETRASYHLVYKTSALGFQLSYTAVKVNGVDEKYLMDRVRLELTPNSVQDCRSAN
jgi:hypothetical protein